MLVVVTNNLQIDLPNKLVDLPNIRHRYIVLYGGRGGAKSWAIAACLILKAYLSKQLILCTREIQNSIKDSVHKLLSDTIDRFGLSSFFEIQRDQILGANGSRFIFKGLHNNINEIKSTEGINHCWIEEAQSVSQESIDVLFPTIREKDSQIWISFNPKFIDDPIYNMFVENEYYNTTLILVNYYDNPFFNDELKRLKDWDKKNDYEKYLHIWRGQVEKISDACIFKGKYTVEDFETPKEIKEFNYGGDWGFSNDPTTGIRSYIIDRTLFIDYEAWGVGVEIDETEQLFDNNLLDLEQHIMIADSARPETISYLNRNSKFTIKAAKKGDKSIQDGISFIKNFEKIVIHKRCIHTIYEFGAYCYKTDKKTGEILKVIVDKNNHMIDALRYSLEPLRLGLGKVKPSKANLNRLGV